jgi:two-component system, NarL family, nitrate/nitrite response regulator NarL
VPTRIIIADDHPIILDGLVHLFTTSHDIEVVTRCIDGEEALSAVRRACPDVLVLDVRMPRRNGIEVLREIHRERIPTKVVLLTAEITDEEVLQAVRLGVGGIVLKEAAPRQLLHAVHLVAEGGEYIDETAIRRALDKMLRREAGLADATRVLTPRELELVRMIGVGLRNKQIAEKLGISEATVKIHLHSVYQKLGISGRLELSIYARDKSLV